MQRIFRARLQPAKSASIFGEVKLIFALIVSAAPFFLNGCADLGPEADNVQEQQLRRSFAAPGQPLSSDSPDDLDAHPHQRVPGE